MSEQVVEMGSNDSVVINKLFGPLILANLRISVDATTGDWLIEREWIKKGEYIPWVSIPGQIAQEFTDQDS